MITLNHVFALPELAPIKLVAGKEGISRPITGVNVMESDRLIEFFKENELLVTTGINMGRDEQKVIAMVRQAFDRHASGIILNVGPYIPRIPDQVIRFADVHQFPVFEMPWVYRVADFVKITVQYLAMAEQTHTQTKDALAKLLYHHVSSDDVAHAFTQLNIKIDGSFAIVVCTLGTDQSIPPALTYIIEGEFSKKYKLLASIREEHQMIYLVEPISGTDVSLSKIVRKINEKNRKKPGSAQVLVGSGHAYTLMETAKSYQEALTVIRLARRHPNLGVYEFSELGAYQMLMDVHDRRVLERHYQKYLGLLSRYDQIHETDYVPFLRVFLEEDGRTANIAHREFIHRNTVLYKVKKIESILGADLCRPFVKTNLLLAFMIEDLRD
ncbi:PucR family transcriptional regulator [Sporolactobacillus kofuensis]|uniref:PucR family transcriptional regulator n=1 Tax=Sporolactobacillus kofuensis TaxID=269672 RepID=A0ABW1WCL2_9BACL|nr:PucR family transcriptional regulator [Sporolactobacillus kofuensis]MCO7174891.1 PucR family transcriptional regulator ligand-binding domain-containing protein [Sporolactobacillus kofuensis]